MPFDFKCREVGYSCCRQMEKAVDNFSLVLSGSIFGLVSGRVGSAWHDATTHTSSVLLEVSGGEVGSPSTY